MKRVKFLVVCLGLAVTLPATAAGEARGDYSSLHPKDQMESAPAALGLGVLVEATGTIEDADLPSRLVTIKGPSGRVVTVEAGEQVKNLAQVKKGDQVTVSYYESMAVELVATAGEQAEPKAQVHTASVSAEPGAKPAGAVGRQERTTVKILGVDPYKKAIAFRGKDGRYREVSVAEPHLEHYLTELKAGDTVEVVYTEALAVSVTAK
jgi:ribosomal 50S subunit-recycling heat shock protein